ncbi:Inosine/uridine-preferring nucleoside hydrolase [Pseudonocardia dioxanivorans CB1190]|uniref:Inosine/uridine-preferring nucleoside hydrolase n=1 Tax=Pseudonocardia dioxanivorans (strain ATCC 55486 / DSM 44775 / JCM 13855 / CB1190) TaxID=675635 RepID=F4CMN5_PSEUX|nr:nucleoside hydrolase [Pseudonocardia dioxanivorans]AEA24402.1 Inosine/uridine-preferring nucleoside hydrolase [Pseudonocardia dioxanivorans CB1190]
MPTPSSLIIDTDPGVDDAFAILLALSSKECDVRAVTASYGNVALDKTFVNARRIVALAGRTDIPVAAGAARPLVHVQAEVAPEWHGADGLGMQSSGFPEPGPADPRPALDLMVSVLRESSVPVTIVCLGPMTNTALLLAAHPELTPRIGRIVAMGGALGMGNTRGAGEFNVYADPEAAHRVLTQPEVPVTLVPLDLTMNCTADDQWLETLSQAGPRCATLVRTAALYREATRERYNLDAIALHDMLAMLEAIRPGTLRTTPHRVNVACTLGPGRGMTVPDRRPDASGPLVDIALDTEGEVVLADALRYLSTLG